MIQHKILEDNEDLILSYSDAGKYIIHPDGDKYKEAIDLKELIENGTIVYTESDELIFDSAENTPLEPAKIYKAEVLKQARDEEESSPILVNGVMFDFDDKARDRINGAITALEYMGDDTKLAWTTADNSTVEVTAESLKYIIVTAAVRSNELHIKYRNLKERLDICRSEAELENINW